ncbi:hypothetical protein SK128_000074 [Halocaridina rubra]|uniref:Uncharacterized protein n=1 Tax=Halocaridina rubra TaxID=373956 RepID=A0AAN8WFT5_HALRR
MCITSFKPACHQVLKAVQPPPSLRAMRVTVREYPVSLCSTTLLLFQTILVPPTWAGSSQTHWSIGTYRDGLQILVAVAGLENEPHYPILITCNTTSLSVSQ